MFNGVMILVLVATGAQFIYSGRTGGSEHRNTGGGTNLQCLPMDTNYLKYQPDKQTCSLINVWIRISQY